ncbi:Mitochondrial phosphate carrier protein 3, mitochondrial, partial [Cucurbita argyrosperma subsp. sororia]
MNNKRIMLDHKLGAGFADTMMKFASFQTIVERLYTYAIPRPKEQCSKSLQLGVRLLPTTGGATTAPAANKSSAEPVCAP